MSPQVKLQILTAVVFGLTYLYLIVRNKYMATALWVGVGVLAVAPPLLGLGPIVTLTSPFQLDPQGGWAAVNWNVIGIMAGTLLLAGVFIHSGVPVVLSDWLIDRSPNVCWAMLGVCFISSFISIFAANVATVLIVAPIAVELARKLKASPAPFLIGIAICSNLQGTATLIGDPPSMILAAAYKMNFNHFFWYRGRPGIFFAVQVGALAGFAVLWVIFRKFRAPVAQIPVPKPKSWLPTVLMCAMVAALAAGSLVDPNFLWFGGTVCLGCGLLSIAWLWRHDKESAKSIVTDYDWSSTFFLIGVFMMVYAMVKTGIVELAATWIAALTGDSLPLAFIIVVCASVLLSAFVDNIPYIAVMLPLVMRLSAGAGEGPKGMVLAYGLLIGSCLGGNITPIGASANVVAYGMLRRMGEKTDFWDFVKIGLPFTLAATAGASLFVWLVCAF